MWDAYVVIECTGVGKVVIDATHLAAPGAVLALTGISPQRAGRRGPAARAEQGPRAREQGRVRHGPRPPPPLPPGGRRAAPADPAWLARLITRRLSAQDWPAALERTPDDVKVVVDMH